MFSNIHNLKGSSLHARNAIPRWRNVFIALMLTLSIGSLGQAPMAQAAPARGTAGFYVSARWEDGSQTRKMFLCENAVIRASVQRKLDVAAPIDPVAPFPLEPVMPGVTVTAALEQKIGTLLPEREETGWGSNDEPNTIEFTFFPTKTGQTEIIITALSVQYGTLLKPKYTEPLSASVYVTVLPCKVKVNTRGKWSVPGPAHIKAEAIIDEGKMTKQGEGHFAGSATVSWTASTSGVRDCSGSLSIGSSKADLSGDMDDTGQLTATITFQPAQASMSSNCPSARQNPSLTPAALKVIMPPEGGVSTQAEVLQGPESTPGSVVIDLTPEEDTAAAYNPLDLLARAALPSAWLAKLQDAFVWPGDAWLSLFR